MCVCVCVCIYLYRYCPTNNPCGASRLPSGSPGLLPARPANRISQLDRCAPVRAGHERPWPPRPSPIEPLRSTWALRLTRTTNFDRLGRLDVPRMTHFDRLWIDFAIDFGRFSRAGRATNSTCSTMCQTFVFAGRRGTSEGSHA